MGKRSKKNKRRSKKIFAFVFVGLVLILAILGGYYYFMIYKKGVIYKTKITIEAGEYVPSVDDYVSEEDLDRVGEIITWTDLEIIDDKVYKPGEYNGSISFRDEELKVLLVVRDTENPIITGTHNFEMIAYEKEPNLMEGVTVSDNSNEEIEIKIEGEYDPEKEGTYELYYTASDSSGNEAKVSFQVVVKKNVNISFSKTSKGFTMKTYYGITYIDDVVIANKSYGLPSNFAPNNLVYVNGYIRVVDYVKDAFNNLRSDASSIGLNIYASSGYRSYGDQNYIYNNYVARDGMEEADTYSARAGFSEHQTGLAIDVNTIDSSFDGTSESNWLRDNCYRYGFIIRYPKGKDSITGYMYEPWHIRYVGKNLANKLYNNGDWITIEEYFGIDSKYK